MINPCPPRHFRWSSTHPNVGAPSRRQKGFQMSVLHLDIQKGFQMSVLHLDVQKVFQILVLHLDVQKGFQMSELSTPPILSLLLGKTCYKVAAV